MTAVAYEPIVTQEGLNAAARAQAEGRVLQITHIAVGTGAYVPVGTETELQNERARSAVHRRKHVEAAIYQVAATITGDADYFASEIGFFADDQGTPVLMFVYSSADRVVAAVTNGQETLLELSVSLGALPAGTVEFSFIDADMTVQELLDDASGEHNEGREFNFGRFRSLEEWQGVSAQLFEQLADAHRMGGQSGIIAGRHYSIGGAFAFHRPSGVSFAALGAHNHANYRLMSGMPEMHAVVNGYRINMRHVDYRWLEPVGGAYLDVEDVSAPPVPPSVTGQPDTDSELEEMRHYMRAFAAKDPSIRDYRDFIYSNLAYLEVWLEDFTDDALIDAAHSFRHQFDEDSLKAMIEKYIALNGSGLKPRFENSSFMPTIIRQTDAKGRPHFSVLRYRVCVVRLGTYREYPIHEMVHQVDDPVTRVARGMSDLELSDSRLGRFTVRSEIGGMPSLARQTGPSLLDEIMAKVPGLDGLGAQIEKQYIDTFDTESGGGEFTQELRNWQTGDPLNAGYYHRFYSYAQPGAAGRRDYRMGFNDPMLFVASNTKPEVTSYQGLGGGHKFSWAIPLELAVSTPLQNWNPYGLTIDGPTGGDGSLGDPYVAAREGRQWYLTPTAFYDGEAAQIGDPADTGQSVYMLDGQGQAQLMRGSGVYVFLPEISGSMPSRLRWPIAPLHHEGGFAFGHAQAVQIETRGVLAAQTAEILKLKLALEGRHNEGDL